MTIVRHDFDTTEGLEKEMYLHDKVDDNRHILQHETLEEFLDSWTHKMHRSEIESVCDHFKPESRILDIGVGLGYTSFYFASRGHIVTVVEPSLALCTVMDQLAQKFNIDLTIHQCTMEHFSSEERFDICLFNASFHHCDEPLRALRNCHASLHAGGRVYLVNEQVLKFYRSKKWYDRARREDPEKMCDYGGNEHTYRIHEYRSMLRRAGFRVENENVPVYYLHPKDLIVTSIHLNDVFSKENGKEIYSDSNILIRFIFYMLLKRLVTIPLTCRLLKMMSLIGITFTGKKV
jgi:SAM-dependent methyltransferase